VVELLLEAGADASAVNDYGCTALIYAITKGIGVVRALLTHGCGDIDARAGVGGGTALW
jgi:ankyrin repeat protein